MREFGFELSLCARLERDREAIVARQLGAGVTSPANRVIDVVVVEPGPAFDARARLTPEAIPEAAIESDAGAGRARYWKDAFDCHPERARRAVERAVEVGFFERERHNGREYVRQVARYPDWFDRLVGIENKPDLGEPGELESQLRTDVSLGLFDAVVLATESHVTGAHLNRIPGEVGVWRVRGGGDSTAIDDEGVPTPEIEVIREPTPLASDEPGVELLAEHPGQADVRVVSGEAKARARRRVAERAYGKGWRPTLPACARAASATVAGGDGLPYCRWKGRLVDRAAECGASCPGHDPAEPPEVDREAVREERTPWVADPDGAASRQSLLDRYG